MLEPDNKLDLNQSIDDMEPGISLIKRMQNHTPSILTFSLLKLTLNAKLDHSKTRAYPCFKILFAAQKNDINTNRMP